MPATYFDLLNADGSVNAAAYDEILENRVAHEVNLRRCNDARIFFRDESLGCAAVFYALAAESMRLPELPADEVARIRRMFRDGLDHHVGVMARAAADMRASMRRAALRVVA
jgi:hypothetical protein